MEENYTKRELDDHFGVVNCKLDTISEQVKNTNGRVKRLELWRSFLAGGLVIITSIVLPLLIYIYTIQMPIQVKTAVAEALEPYELPNK